MAQSVATPTSLSFDFKKDASGIVTPKVASKVLGIDPIEYAKGMEESIKAKGASIQEKIDLRTKKLGALSEMESKARALKDALNSLKAARPIDLMSGTSTSVFDSVSPSLKFSSGASSGGSNPGNVLAVSVAPGTKTPNMSVTVNRLAIQDVALSQKKFDSQEAPIFSSDGTFVINGTSLNVTSKTTLRGLKDLINNTPNTKAVAGIDVNSDGKFCLKVQHQDTGVPISISGSDTHISEAVAIKSDKVAQAASQLTSRDNARSKRRFSTEDDKIFSKSGNFKINGVGFSVDSSTSIRELAEKINKESRANAVATIDKDSDGKIFLKIEDSRDREFISFEGSDDDCKSSLPLESPNVIPELQASISVNGKEVVSSSNTVMDAVEGVSLTLIEASPNPIDISFSPDYMKTSDALKSFVDAYNDLIEFGVKQGLHDANGNPLEGAVLRQSVGRRTLVTDLPDLTSSPVKGLENQTLSTLSKMGIVKSEILDPNKPEAKYNLEIKDADFANSLLSRYGEFKSFFSRGTKSSDTNVLVSGLPDAIHPKVAGVPFTTVFVRDGNEYSVKVTLGADTYTFPATVDGDGIISATAPLPTVDDPLKPLPPSTPFDGMSFSYVGPALASGTKVSSTQQVFDGLGDKLNSLLDQLLDPVNGSFAAERKVLEADNKAGKEKIAAIDQKALAKSDKIMKQFAALQALQAQFENLKQMMKSYFEDSKD